MTLYKKAETASPSTRKDTQKREKGRKGRRGGDMLVVAQCFAMWI